MENKDFRKNTGKNDEFINLTDIIKIFTKNWKWFALSIFLFLGMGVLYILMKNPVFVVDALVLLKEDEKKSGASSAAMSMVANIGDLGSMMGSKNIDNEVVVFNTRQIMKKSILKLNMHVTSEMWDGLRKVNPYPFAPFNVTVDPLQVDTMRYSIEFTMKPMENNQYKIKGKYYKTKFETIVSSFPATIKTPSIDVHIDKNPFAIPEKKPKSVDVTIHNPNELAILLKKEIGAGATSKKTTIIGISTKTDNVKWAQDLINEMISTFNKDAVIDKNMAAKLTAEFVDDRLIKIEEELSSVEKQVEKYKQTNQLTDLSSEARLYLQQMNQYENRQIETEMRLRLIQYIDEYVRDDKNKNNLIPTIGIDDRSLVTVIAKYNELLTEKNRLESASTQSNPSLQLVNSQLISLHENILSNLNNTIKSLQITLKDLKKQDVLTASKIEAVPRQEREFIEIRRQQDIKSTLYTFLLQKREETNLSLASTTPKAKIIDEPMPGIKPIAPKKSIVLFIILCLGIGIPFAFFYLKKLLKTEIDSKEELEGLSNAEIIGEICNDSSSNKIAVRPHETNASVELFRLLRTNLSFVLQSPAEKVILLTSTVPGEGKTYVSINLAASLALIDKKVLVIGLDIRNPRLGDYLDTPSGKGVTNYLIDNTLTVSDIIQHSGVHANLDIIQAGPIPPNPNELLLNSRLDDLFTNVRKLYDYIIVDTAPVGLVSDTFHLNRIADLNLYVVRIGVAHKDSVKYLNSIKEKGRLKNLYAVANGIDLKEKNGGYGYGYGIKSK